MTVVVLLLVAVALVVLGVRLEMVAVLVLVLGADGGSNGVGRDFGILVLQGVAVRLDTMAPP